MADKRNSGGLNDVYLQYGVDSNEFYEYVKPFIGMLIRQRMYGYYSEDVFNQCWLTLVTSIRGGVKRGYVGGEYKEVPVKPYYNGKTNIATWINTIVRNQTSSAKYRNKKRSLHSEEFLEVVPVEEVESNELENVEQVLSSLKTVSFVEVENVVELLRSSSSNDFLVRFILWENIRLKFS